MDESEAMRHAREPLLSIQQLSVELPTSGRPVQLLSGIDLEVHRGESVCVVGESGCGKSMTSLSVMRLLPPPLRPSAGQVRFEGRDLLGLKEREMERLRGNDIAMIFQDPMTALNPVLSIGEQLIEGYVRHGKGTPRAGRERATALLARVGVQEPADRLRQYPNALSGGMRQRVMIAMALMCEPRLIVADEPTTALDVSVQAQVLALLRELKDEMNLGLLLITHDLSVVANVADRVAVMYAGQVVETGPVAQVLRDPQHPYTRGLLDCLPGRGHSRRGQPLGSIPGMVAGPGSTRVGCRFRARCSLAGTDCASPQGSTWRGDGDSRGVRCLRPGVPRPVTAMEAT